MAPVLRRRRCSNYLQRLPGIPEERQKCNGLLVQKYTGAAAGTKAHDIVSRRLLSFADLGLFLHTFSRTFYAPVNVCMFVHILSLSGSMPGTVLEK